MTDEAKVEIQEEAKKLSKREEVAAAVAAEKDERVKRCGQRISEILKDENCAFNVAPKFVPVDEKGKYGISCEMILSAL